MALCAGARLARRAATGRVCGWRTCSTTAAQDGPRGVRTTCAFAGPSMSCRRVRSLAGKGVRCGWGSGHA